MSETTPAGETLNAAQFTNRFSEMVAELIPDAEISVVGDLTLAAVTEDRTVDIALDNAYRDYEKSGAFEDVFEDLAPALLQHVFPEEDAKLELHCIVPVIRGPEFLPTVREQLGLGAEEESDDLPAHFPLADGLTLFYVYDSADTVEFISKRDLDATGVPLERIRKVAVENLHAILPEIELHGIEGAVMLVAGGNYEASLILYNSLWDDGTLPIEGTPIVGVPNRDLLIVTGSENAERIEQTRAFVEDSFESGSYPISKDLFIRNDGGWTRYR